MRGHSLWTEQSARRRPDQQKHQPHEDPTREALQRLEARLFPAGSNAYKLIAPNNRSPRRVDTLTEVYAALDTGEAASAAGILAHGVLGLDGDPENIPLGDSIEEKVVAWCKRRDLYYLVRYSGRPGGRHIIALASRAADHEDWADLCRNLTRQLKVPVTNRTGQALRLLTAPHRAGLDAPVVRNTMHPAMIVESKLPQQKTRTRRRRRPRATGWSGVVDGSRSANEYGDTLVHARRGNSSASAWQHVNRAGTKSQENGRNWWRRYMWLPAVTLAAAEAGASEDDAWARAREADPTTTDKLGRRWWTGLWEHACEEAATDRPRRRALSTEQTLTDEQRNEISAVSTGLRTCASTVLPDLDPRSKRSVGALLDVIARPIVTRAGGAAVRVLAEDGALSTGTVRKWLERLCATEVLQKTGRYDDGQDQSDSYGIGPAAREFVQAALEALTHYSPTCCSTPGPRGRANVTRLQQLHTRERSFWKLRTRALTALQAGETLKTSQHPLAKLVRSRWVQKHWWAQQNAQQRAERIAARQQRLGEMSTSDRGAWFDWLAVRGDLTVAVDSVLSGTPTAEHVQTLVQLRPLRTFHRGLADPDWRGAADAHAA